MIPQRILIVEDNAIIAQDLKGILEDLGHEVTAIAMSFKEALDCLLGDSPSLCLIDIVLSGDKDGITLAETINRDFGIPFLFVTSHSDRHTVERATQALPRGYVLKPFDKHDVFTSINLALALSETLPRQRKSISIRQAGFVHKVYLDEVMYVQSDGNYIDFYLTDGRKYSKRMTIKEFLSLAEAVSFVQIHKSYAANVDMITQTGGQSIVVNGVELPLGKTFVSVVRERVG